MKLLKLHIENFGTLHNFTFSPKDGLNVLHQQNGWGKSTLAVFIKAMLYGLPASTKRSLDENERKKYTPWQGGVFGGSMEFETARGRFRVERTFAAKESGDSFALFDLATNKPSSIYSQSLGEELFGIDADGFERSTYLSQRTVTTSKDNNSIAAKLGNLLDDVGDIGNFDIALAALDKRRKYYTLSGNRGAIAELEQEKLEKLREKERCERISEAMRAQEADLAECAAAIQETRRTAVETRTRLQQAALAREHRTLLEQKNKMLAEIRELTQQKQEIDRFFCNLPPTEAEIEENYRLYESIKTARAASKMLASPPTDADRLARLRNRYPNGLPTAAEQEQSTVTLTELRDLHSRKQALQGAMEHNALTARFENGIPEKERMNAAFTALAQADTLRKKRDAQKPVANKNEVRSSLFPVSIVFLLFGVLLAALAFLPSLAEFTVSLLAGGLVCLIAAATVFVIGRRKVLAIRRQIEQEELAYQQKTAQINHLLDGVRELLSAYAMPCDGDLGRALTELSMLIHQFVESEKKNLRLQEQVTVLDRRIRTLANELGAALSPYRKEGEDYAALLTRLRQDSILLSQLERTERVHLQKQQEADERLLAMQRQLLPFLSRYDPSSRMRAGECLQKISEQYTEHRRLTLEIERKEAELRAFIRQKQLDSIPSEITADDYDKLVQAEKELQTNLETQQRHHTELKAHINRLATDADRIPELVSQIEQLDAQLREAKENAATINHTVKFLEDAKLALSTRYLGDMQESFRRFLSVLTQNEAPEAVMDTSFEVSLRQGGQTRTMESFSRGWRDAVQFCVRLSLTEALYKEGERPFLLLDDPFVNLDDSRLKAARRLLDLLAADYQVFYMVCHRERA